MHILRSVFDKTDTCPGTMGVDYPPTSVVWSKLFDDQAVVNKLLVTLYFSNLRLIPVLPFSYWLVICPLYVCIVNSIFDVSVVLLIQAWLICRYIHIQLHQVIKCMHEIEEKFPFNHHMVKHTHTHIHIYIYINITWSLKGHHRMK